MAKTRQGNRAAATPSTTPRRRGPGKRNPRTEPPLDTIEIITQNSLRHGTFKLPQPLLRDRSAYFDAKCLEIFEEHEFKSTRRVAAKPPIYQISLPDIEHDLFASYEHLLISGEVELDFPYSPVQSIDEAWDRLIDLWELCAWLEDPTGMNVVMDAVVEHISIDFPGRMGVKRVYQMTDRAEDPWRRVLVDEVVEKRSGEDVIAILEYFNDADFAEFRRQVMTALMAQREKTGRAVGVLRSPGRYHVVS